MLVLESVIFVVLALSEHDFAAGHISGLELKMVHVHVGQVGALNIDLAHLLSFVESYDVAD